MGSEESQRKYSRLKHSFIAKIRILEVGRPIQLEKWDIVTIRDLSAGGLSFNYTQKIPIDTMMEFKLGLSLSVGRIECRAKVTRIDEAPANEKLPGKILIHGIAVKFIDITNEQQEAINKLVQDFQNR